MQAVESTAGPRQGGDHCCRRGHPSPTGRAVTAYCAPQPTAPQDVEQPQPTFQNKRSVKRTVNLSGAGFGLGAGGGDGFAAGAGGGLLSGLARC